MEYPGYGVYEDKNGCSAEKIRRDCDHLWHYIVEVKKIDKKDILVFGRSIGSGAAIHLAS